MIESPKVYFSATFERGQSLSVRTKLAITLSPADRQILAHSDVLVSLGLLFLARSVLCLCLWRGRESECVQERESVKERSRGGG